MASKINEKLGLNPKTRTRAATHSSMLAPDQRCPKCDGRHVLKNVVKRQFMCGSCSHFWSMPSETA